jgi:hypothetical protein
LFAARPLLSPLRHARRGCRVLPRRTSGPAGDDRGAGRGDGNSSFRTRRNDFRADRGSADSHTCRRVRWPQGLWRRSPPSVTAMGPELGIASTVPDRSFCPDFDPRWPFVTAERAGDAPPGAPSPRRGTPVQGSGWASRYSGGGQQLTESHHRSWAASSSRLAARPRAAPHVTGGRSCRTTRRCSR